MPKSKVRKKKKAKPQTNRYIQIENNIRMSEIILDYVSPFINIDIDNDDMELIVPVGILVWNLSFMQSDEIEKTMPQLCKDIKEMVEESDEEIYDMVEFMLRRRYEEFGDINRLVVGYDIYHNGIENVLNISSQEFSRVM